MYAGLPPQAEDARCLSVDDCAAVSGSSAEVVEMAEASARASVPCGVEVVACGGGSGRKRALGPARLEAARLACGELDARP